MKLVLQILFIAVMAFFLELFFPWWSIAIAAFAGGLLVKESPSNFLGGFIAIALLWSLKALVIHSHAATPLAEKVAHIFQLPGSGWLITIMSIIGGLVGGLGALTGSQLRNVK